MILAVIIISLTCLAIILSVLLFPTLRLGRLTVSSFWIIATLGALLLCLTGRMPLPELFAGLGADNAVNPLKILVLFLSMTALSVYLDEVGFFGYLAAVSLRIAKNRQIPLFFSLYAVVSILTVFTSNDVIILTFTPFICYFAKNAGIRPLPYLIAEFVAANTWSMALLIGNPTNIYLGESAGITFADYTRVMLLPTVLAGTTSVLVLFLLFRKALREPMQPTTATVTFRRKLPLIIGILHLASCTVLLAISSYVKLEMWLIALGFALSLFFFSAVIALFHKRRPLELARTLLRLPWQLVPFVLSMFVLVLSLGRYGVTERLAELLSGTDPLFSYGALSFLCSNLLNNIPMSVLFSSILQSSGLSGTAYLTGVYATVIGSNIGAYLTPLGALAGIMWSSLLTRSGISLSFRRFVRYGILLSVPTMLAALLGLMIVL